MNTAIKTLSTSAETAVCSDVVLREGTLIRLIFRPSIVNNNNDKACSVRGIFIYQRRKKDESWDDINEESLLKLKAGEGYKLELKSKEVRDLWTNLESCYSLFEQYGVPRGKKEFVVTTNNLSSVISQLLEDPEKINELVNQGEASLIVPLIHWFSKFENKTEVLTKLNSLEINNLQNLNTLIGLSSLKRALALWQKNQSNDDELYWQRVLNSSSWILAQVFAAPVILVKEKAFLGGKSISNTKGSIVDYLFKNSLTHNTAIIELKPPTTPLLGSKYRNRAFPPSADLSGAIAQVLNYRDNFIRESDQLLKHDSPLTAIAPRCLIIVGRLVELQSNPDRLRSFELFKSELRNIEIITFDELFAKIEALINLLECTPDNN